MARDPLGKAEEQKDWLAKIGSYIPGFSGYLDAKRRQESDRIIREAAAKKVMECRDDVTAVVKHLTKTMSDLDLVEEMDEIDNRINTLAGKIRSAADGYSGALNTIKVSQKDLEDLYKFDLNLLEAVEELKVASAKMSENKRDTGACRQALEELDQVLDRVSKYLATRKDSILGMV